MRGVLNFIFAYVTGGLDNFFEGSSINTKSDYDRSAAKAYQQNELHFLGFGDYSDAADGKTPNVSSLISSLQNAQSFDEFKDKAFPVLIREEKHLEFIVKLCFFRTPRLFPA